MSGKLPIGAVRSLPCFILALFAIHTLETARAENADKRIVGKIDYWFVGHLGQTDDSGRTLVWEATIEGDVDGTMRWWFVNPPPVPRTTYSGGHSAFYAARWELWDDEQLLLAGETAGKTVFPDGTDGIWDGHGRVTEATPKFASSIGYKVYESGPVMLGQDPPKTFSGTGIFVIY